MPRDPESPSWWHTLPGVLTAIAALITAIGGLVAILIQAGVIHTSRGTLGPGPVESSSSAATPSGGYSAPAARDSFTLRPWAATDAVLTDASGATTVVRAETLSNCISVNHVLSLTSGQDIPFERMRSFEVVRADPAGAPQAKATVRIRLLDGHAVEGGVDAQCDIFGYNDLGRYTTTLQTLKRVEFRR